MRFATLSATVLLVGTAMTSGAAAQTPAPARPPACAADPIFQQQDFTLGTWDVFNGRDGTEKTATVRMERALDGCAIDETWTAVEGARESDGLGLFTYSRLLKAWHYFWVAEGGGTTYFTGGLTAPNAMRYVTTAPTADGGKRLRHWTLSLEAGGRVRELAVSSLDDGKTWKTDYDLWWTKHK